MNRFTFVVDSRLKKMDDESGFLVEKDLRVSGAMFSPAKENKLNYVRTMK